MKMNNGVYNVLKNVAQIYLPGLGTLYAALALIWHLPAAAEVTGTVVAVDTFLGVILGISSATFSAANPHAGDAVVTTDPVTGKKDVELQLDGDPLKLINQDRLIFTVIQK